MGLYVRKTIKAGPFRLTASSSGINVSTGVPGFRVGSGPRGNYVSLSSHGVTYRTSVGGVPRQRSRVVTGPPYQQQSPDWRPKADVPLDQSLLGASTEALHPTGPGDLLQQINEAAARTPVAPWSAIPFVVLLLAVPPVGAILLLVGIPLVAWLHMRDRARRTVVMFYDVEGPVAGWFEAIAVACRTLSNCHKLWRLNASGVVRTTYQYKTNAGASSIVQRSPLSIDGRGCPFLSTNVEVPTLKSGRQALYLLPDRILVRDGKRFSDVAYTALDAACIQRRFIEDGQVPRDAQQIATTWQYVNVKGGPDRRYKNNRQLPVMLYGQLTLRSVTGLMWQLDCSRTDLPQGLAELLHRPPREALKPLGVLP